MRPSFAALHLAADAGQCEAVSRLVALGAPVDVASNKGATPLSCALQKVGRACAGLPQGLPPVSSTVEWPGLGPAQ